MAMDTPTKRFSAAYPLCPWRGMLSIPDGTIGAIDRLTTAFLYGGVAAAEAGSSTDETISITLNRWKTVNITANRYKTVEPTLQRFKTVAATLER